MESIYEGAKHYGVELPDIDKFERAASRSLGLSESPSLASEATSLGPLFGDHRADSVDSDDNLTDNSAELSSLASLE